jgi:hypothetical protein
LVAVVQQVAHQQGINQRNQTHHDLAFRCAGNDVLIGAAARLPLGDFSTDDI